MKLKWLHFHEVTVVLQVQGGIEWGWGVRNAKIQREKPGENLTYWHIKFRQTRIQIHFKMQYISSQISPLEFSSSVCQWLGTIWMIFVYTQNSRLYLMHLWPKKTINVVPWTYKLYLISWSMNCSHDLVISASWNATKCYVDNRQQCHLNRLS